MNRIATVFLFVMMASWALSQAYPPPLPSGFFQPALAQSNPNQTPQNCSGTIAAGGAAQVLLAASNTRRFYQIQNLSTDLMAFSELTTSPATLTNNSWTIAAATGTSPGGSYTSPSNYVPSSAVWIIAATTGDRFSCVYW